MNEKYREYLKTLSPELREKAKSIKTQEQLEEFLSDNDIELPEDTLAAVSGGCGGDDENQIYPNACPDCGGDLEYVSSDPTYNYRIRTIARCLKTGARYVCEYGVWSKL